MALLVSLIALVVAFLQLCQQYFATADGYRNCAESVIGPWHRTRHRRFVPSEFRFETVYDAPLIRLLSKSEYADRINDPDTHEKRVHLLYPLHENTCCEGGALLRETVFGALPEALTHGWRSKLPKWIGLRGLPKGAEAKNDGEKGASAPRREYQERPSALVSWICEFVLNLRLLQTCVDFGHSFAAFMSELHETYRLYDQDSDGNDLKANQLLDEFKEDKKSGLVSNNATQPVVEQQRVHWDFRGSNITRPVAQTRLGDIILFALRMGMQWRRINVERGTLLAFGKGYSLSSANQSGLIVTFTSTGFPEKPPRIVPSEFADKMLFGILPGDPDLVKQDFRLVSREGEVHRELEEHILERILEHRRFDPGVHIKFWTRAARQDLKKLLCPFFPQEHANTATVRFLGWPWHRVASILHFFESRVAFIQKLDAEVKHHLSQYSEEDSILLRSVKTGLDKLKDEYPSDFYCINFTHRNRQGISPAALNEDFNSLLKKCREIFDSCTKNLTKHNWHLEVDKAPDGGSTKFALLVAAHTFLTNNSTREAKNELQQAERGLKNGDWAEYMGLEKQAPPEAKKKPHLGNPGFYFRMNKIVQNMKSEDRGIQQELAKLGVEVTATDAQLAWWMMMIRGIAWDMSCYREPWPADERFVPSTFYGDPTPVMLA